MDVGVALSLPLTDSNVFEAQGLRGLAASNQTVEKTYILRSLSDVMRAQTRSEQGQERMHGMRRGIESTSTFRPPAAVPEQKCEGELTPRWIQEKGVIYSQAHVRLVLRVDQAWACMVLK